MRGRRSPTRACLHHTSPLVYTCNGFNFDVEVPTSCASTAAAVSIIDVPGRTMNAAMEDANTGMRARGDAAGYHRDPAERESGAAAVDLQADAGGRREALRLLHARDRGLSPSISHRVHMTGFSEGGFMTWRFLCDHADLFASVAPGAAASNCTSCRFPLLVHRHPDAEPPGPVLYMHGTADEDYVQYECAQPQIDAMVAAWGLTSQGVIASNATYRRTRWTNASGGLLEFISHDYYSDQEVLFIPQTKLEGHCYPGSTDPGGLAGQLFSFKCEQPASFTWGDEVMKFFVAHPKP